MARKSRTAATCLVGLAALATVAGCAKHDAGSALAAPWAIAQGSGADAQRVVLSSDAIADEAKAPGVTLRIVCPGGHPNVELSSLTAKCYGYCGQNPTVEVEESFVSATDPHARLASASVKSVASSPPFDQDLLSNAPDDFVVSGDSKAGVTQNGKWIEPASSDQHGVQRFSYGSSYSAAPPDPKYLARIDTQARNYINRLATGRWFRIGDDRFDTRGLAAKLPQFWASCPASKTAR